jgi:hypothetical protein
LGWGSYLLPFIEQASLQERMIDAGAIFVYIRSGNNKPMHESIPPGHKCAKGSHGSNSDGYHGCIKVDQNFGDGPKTVLDAFICPSDILPKKDNDGFGKSNYCVCLGDNGPWTGNKGWGNPNRTSQNGMFRLAQSNDWTHCVPFAEVTDGLSNTIMLGEVTESHRIHAGKTDGAYPIWAGGNNNDNGQWRFCSWGRLVGANFYINHDRKLSDSQFSNTGYEYSNYSFGSQHPGGAQFCLGDASVVLLNEDIDTTLYTYMGNARDGQSITIPD